MSVTLARGCSLAIVDGCRFNLSLSLSPRSLVALLHRRSDCGLLCASPKTQGGKLPPGTLTRIYISRDIFLRFYMSNTTAPKKSILGILTLFTVKSRCDLAETRLTHGRRSYGIRANLSRMEKKMTALALSLSLYLSLSLAHTLAGSCTLC